VFLIKLKGIEYFMKSFEYLKYKEEVKYPILGEDQEKDHLKKFESKEVIFENFTNNSEKKMINNVHIVVVSSIIPLKAFKCGIPAISTDIGWQAEIVKDKEEGYYVPIKDSKASAKKMDFFINNKYIYTKLSKQCIEYSKSFSKDEYKKTINKIFKEIE